MPILSDPFSTKLYAIAFLIPQFAPGWRSLVSAVIVDILSFAYILNCDADGPTGVVGIAVAALVLLGFSAGLCTRIATLLCSPFSVRPLRCVLLTTVGFFVLPVCLWLDVRFTLVLAVVIFALPYCAWIWSMRAGPNRPSS